jgi:glycosyltransferase involved in cell wall biosynthesis
VIRFRSTQRMGARPQDIRTVLGFFRNFLEIYQPDVMLTYGGDPITNGLIDTARRRRIPVVVVWDRVRAEDRAPQFVTFINPSLQKGAWAFVRIARELGRRRPDIPILVVESRGTRDTLTACVLDTGACTNVRFMPNTSDPRQFWSVTRIALMPSLCWENQPLVAVEAMINGIPVVASNRGGTPETLGDCGFALPLPPE